MEEGGEVVSTEQHEVLTMKDAREALRSLFGHSDFRDGQEHAVSRLIAGESCAAIFPTGAGKSICYQVPGALMAKRGLGLTLVVSPLIALMKDQTDALAVAGVPCAKLDSTLEADEVREIYEQIRAGTISLLYVSPERFNNERFMGALKGVKVALFVVDEAHCISEWGHNFRPDYLRLAAFARAANAGARLALTATATPKVSMDIASRLDIPLSNVVRTPFYRPMLSLSAVRAPDNPIERTKTLARCLLEGDGVIGGETGLDWGGATMVYVTLQKTAEEVAAALVMEGVDARPYHAGLPNVRREETQEWFMNASDGASPVVVGTIAFGMGLDKKNVRRVFHFNLPKSPEDLAQQVGRAGRDGEAASCLTLVSAADLPILKSFVYGGTPSPAAVLGLLRTVFATVEDQIDFNFYDISQELDTRDLVLKTLLAHLQIMGLVREMTPFYATADVGLTDEGITALATSNEGHHVDLPKDWLQLLEMAVDILGRKRSGSKWATLHVDDAADVLGVPITQIARTLSGMANAGLIIRGKPGKIRSRFQILRRPANGEEEASLARHLYETALELEARELDRIDKVVEILCSNEGGTVSSGLSRYFGDSAQTVSEAMAKENSRSSNVLNSLADLLAPPEVPEAEIDYLWQTGLLDLLREHHATEKESGDRVIPRDDPYLLARYAAGIRSPRIGKLRLAQLGSFGCCAHCPFSALLERAKAVTVDTEPDMSTF